MILKALIHKDEFVIIETRISPNPLESDRRSDKCIEIPYLNDRNDVITSFIFYPHTHEFWIDTEKWIEFKKSNEYHRTLNGRQFDHIYFPYINIKGVIRKIDEFAKGIVREENIDKILKTCKNI